MGKVPVRLPAPRPPSHWKCLVAGNTSPYLAQPFFWILFMSRYSRQERFAPLGSEGQSRLAASRVLICGCGALGSMIAERLARAGVGYLRLLDRDWVELSNL